MKFPFRRKPLSLILCCTFAGALAVGYAAAARAQGTAPFRVDPRLLDLPPLKPAPAAVEASPERPAAEARAIAPPAVETRPLPASPTAARAPAATAEPGARVPTAAPAAASAAVPPRRGPATAVERVASETVASESSSPARGSRSEAVSPRPATAATAVAGEPAGGDGSPLPPPVAPPVPATPATRPPVGPPLALQAATAIQPPPSDSDVPRPVFLSARRLSGVLDREAVAEEDAELRKVGTVLTADRMTYWPIEDEVEASGNVRLQQGEDQISGTQARLKLEDQVGFFDQASYFVKRQPKAVPPAESEPTTGFAVPRAIAIKPGQTRVKAEQKPANALTEARGEAERIDLEGENQYHLTAATFTTCKPGSEDWYFTVADLRLDYDNEVGTGSDATLRFFDVPILHSPWLSFPLNDERKSGVLTPTYGSSNSSGIEVVVPYYWNIAPNMDATFYPRVMSKRGVQLGSQFRYLNEAFGGIYRGDALFEYLPNDRLADRDRWGVALQHTQTTATGFSGTVNYNRVSDNDYYTDLSSRITQTSQTQLLQQGTLTYGGGGWWTATATVQSFQTLEPDPKNPVTKPYRLLPQVTVNARQPDLFFTDSSFYGQYTSFVHPEKALVEGQRLVLQPQISVPFVTPGWYVTPRVGVNITHYDLSYPTGGFLRPESISRTLPIFSVDSGMTFERSSVWFDREYTQTLEPRLFYLNIPYKNQDDIPIFDTALADFNFAQIFADNQFSGWDRINNANQLTAALSSRLIDPANGAEIMRAMIGQLIYFSDDKVTLPGTTMRKWGSSDFLAAFSGQVWPRLYVDAALQYDPSDSTFERYAVGARYHPSPGKALNASYVFNTDASVPIKQVDFSGQWPITGRWQAVGRYNYSFLQNTPIEIIGGLEYNAGCWAVRTVAHRLQTAQADSTTQFFVQLELSGLSSVGSGTQNLLQRRIPGYAGGVASRDQSLAQW